MPPISARPAASSVPTPAAKRSAVRSMRSSCRLARTSASPTFAASEPETAAAAGRTTALGLARRSTAPPSVAAGGTSSEIVSAMEIS